MNAPEHSPWERLAAARRIALAASDSGPSAPEPGFASRLASRVSEFLQNERVRLWSRWCLIAAAAGGLTALGFGAFAPKPPPTDSPLRAPQISVPFVAP